MKHIICLLFCFTMLTTYAQLGVAKLKTTDYDLTKYGLNITLKGPENGQLSSVSKGSAMLRSGKVMLKVQNTGFPMAASTQVKTEKSAAESEGGEVIEAGENYLITKSDDTYYVSFWAPASTKELIAFTSWNASYDLQDCKAIVELFKQAVIK